MLQQKHTYLPFSMAWNISCTTHTKQSCIQGIKYTKNDINLQRFFKSSKDEINQTQQYSKFLCKYCHVDHARNLTDRRSVTSTAQLFNGTIVHSCYKKHTKILRRSSNDYTREMYTGVVD